MSENHLVPTWLEAGDEPFVGAVLDEVSALHGLSVGEADLAVRGRLGKLARGSRFSSRIAEGLWLIERRRWESRVDAPVVPEQLRDVLFELSARLPREEAIAAAS
jgi:hypothetical protein